VEAGGGADVEATGVADGRTRRRLRSREAVVDAILDLLGEGHAQPTSAQVSERSGVSLRSVFRLFDDMESLHRAAVARQADRVAALMAPLPSSGPLAERVAALAASRALVLEAISPVRRSAMRLAATSAPLAAELARTARSFRAQVAEVFAAELAAPGGGTGLLEALDVATSWEVWDRLRVTQGLDVDDARAAVARLVGALLTDPLLTDPRAGPGD
jgi:TetR/AcrR family transcriptional regulator, regulator of autoinduction and epiphytic fitness